MTIQQLIDYCTTNNISLDTVIIQPNPNTLEQRGYTELKYLRLVSCKKENAEAYDSFDGTHYTYEQINQCKEEDEGSFKALML